MRGTHMSEIDKDMWQKQEDINTILNALVPSDEEVARLRADYQKLSWIQKKIKNFGDDLDGFWLIGYLKRLDKIDDDGTVHYKSKFGSVWGEVRHKLVGRVLEKKINDQTYYFFAIFYIQWIFGCIWNWITFQWVFYNIKKNVKPSI